MMRGANTNGMVGLAVFPATGAAIAAPTASDCESPLSHRCVVRDYTPDTSGYAKRGEVTGPRNRSVAGAVVRFHKLPVSYGGASLRQNHTKSFLYSRRTGRLWLVRSICIFKAPDRDLRPANDGIPLKIHSAGLESFQLPALCGDLLPYYIRTFTAVGAARGPPA
jgi:hypothetical protein